MEAVSNRKARFRALLALAGVSPLLMAQSGGTERPVLCSVKEDAGGALYTFNSSHRLEGGRLLPGNAYVTVDIRASEVRDNPAAVEQRFDRPILRLTYNPAGQATKVSFMDSAINLHGSPGNVTVKALDGRGRQIHQEFKPTQLIKGVRFSMDSMPVSLASESRFSIEATGGMREISRYGFQLTPRAFAGRAKALSTASLRLFDGSRFDTSSPNGGRADKACNVSNCFLTTAAVQAIGLSDDCWELESLRAFRDGALARMSGGGALIESYYSLAPQVVRGVDARPDGARIWLRAYWFGILPAAAVARVGLSRPALAIYAYWTRRLAKIAGIGPELRQAV